MTRWLLLGAALAGCGPSSTPTGVPVSASPASPASLASSAPPVAVPSAGGPGSAPGAAVTGPPADVCAKTLVRPPGMARPQSPDPAGWTRGRPEVDLRGLPGVDADTLFEVLTAPDSSGLVSLDLSGLPLGHAGKALGAAALPGLRRLWVEETGLGEVGLRGLFFSEGLPVLEVLDASDAGLEEEALAALQESRLLEGLRSLDLRDSAVPGEAILAALADGDAPRLVCLAVTGPVRDATRAAWATRGVTLVVSP